MLTHLSTVETCSSVIPHEFSYHSGGPIVTSVRTLYLLTVYFVSDLKSKHLSVGIFHMAGS